MLNNREGATHKYLCIVHELNYEDVANKQLSFFFVQSEERDRGLAEYEIQEQINEINKELDNRYILSLHGRYSGEKKIHAINSKDLSIKLIKQKIRSCS